MPEPTRTPPRVLIVAATDRRRGAEVFSERLRNGLAGRGWPVDAVALVTGGDGPTVSLDRLTDLTPDVAGRFSPAVLAALRRRIRELRPDVVVANGGATLRYAALATVGLGARLAYVAIGEPAYWLRSPMARQLNRALLGRPDRVLAVSEATARQLAALRPGVADRVVVVLQGVPEPWFRLRPSPPPGPLRALFVGNLSAEKDPWLAVQAVAASVRSRLRFVGTGPLVAEVESWAHDLGIADRVEVAGPTDDVGAELQRAHVLLLTSRTEGLPGVIMEAAAAGLPTVGVDVGGVPEAVIDGVTGIVAPRDAAAIGRSLDRLDENRSLLAELGAAARADAEARFTLDAAIDRYAEALCGMRP